MQGIGIGTMDFKKMRVNDYYYIDKTMYIKDILDNKSEVILVTRPRRFGKTLNMSILRYYFDIKCKDSKELFKGLKIMKQDEYYTSKLGAFPVIYLSLKDINGSNIEEMLLQLKTELVEVFIDYAELLKSEKLLDIEKEMFSYFDVGKNTAESFYHAFILGMLVGLKDSYYVKSNRESGYGRYDIMLEPKEKNSFIMEFKIAKEMEEKELKAKIKEAKEQIKDKKYEQELKERGFKNITKMVFVCNGKEIKMEIFK